LSRRLPRPRQTANALHPGLIATNLFRNTPRVLRAGMNALQPLLVKSVAEGAATQCYLAVHPGVTENGEYFADCNVAKSSALGRDPRLAARLWETSERIAREL
jgi:retinol dehydrogenase 12